MNTPRISLEMIIIMLFSIAGMFLLPGAKLLFSLVPIAYLLIERRMRRRSWAEIGLNFKAFWPDMRANWLWFLLAGLVSQPLTLLVARMYLPDFVQHVSARLPMDPASLLLALPILLITVLGEELTYRSLFQGRLSLLTGVPIALLSAALVFSLVHFAPGPMSIVVFDLGTIFIDAILYGLIYARSQNATVTWAAHFLGNVMGLIALLTLA